MHRLFQPCLQVTRLCTQALLTLGCWTLWLLLLVILGFQIHILTSSELELPRPLLRAIETRLAASGVSTTFGRTTFDPSGRLLVEDIICHHPSYPDPIFTARALYIRLDPWALLVGRAEELELHATGVTLLLPAMLSPSGRSEELVRNLDATFLPSSDKITIPHLTFELGTLRVSARGTLPLPPQREDRSAPLPIPNYLAKNFPSIARGLGAITAQLSQLDNPTLDVVLSASHSGPALADFILHAQSLNLTTPALTTGPITAITRLPLSAAEPITALIHLTAENLTAPANQTSATRLQALVRAQFQPSTFTASPIDLELSAAEITAAGVTLHAPSLRLTPQPLPSLVAELNTRVAGLPLAAQAHVDLHAQTAEVYFNARVDDGLLNLISERIGHRITTWIDFPKPVTISEAHAHFGPGWKWEMLNARLSIPIINAYHVPISDAHTVLELTPTRWYAPEAFGRIGENYARGSYEHDPANHRYRFLLAGQLRPIDISGWFGSWWSDFFKTFEFRAAPPPASVEVAGRWGRNTGGESSVIVAAQADSAVLRGAHFDYARTRLFIRPHFLEALELNATEGPGALRGTFTRALDPRTLDWHRFDFAFTTQGIDLSLAEKIFGAAASDILSPFAFTSPPALRISGRIDSATSNIGAHQSIDLNLETNTEFRFHDFPVERIAFNGTVRDDTLTLDRLDLDFAGGTATGRAKVSGAGAQRRVGFDYALKDASLGRAISVLETYAARRKNTPTPAPNRFLAEKSNVRISVAASAEGAYDDPNGYHGEGSATLDGASLGEVKLLGLLSELFSFTSLRFNAVRANFKINGRLLEFSDVGLTGSNSAIVGSGSYALDARTLDFKAKIYPFQESSLFLKSIVGAVLTPFSNVFEVKLTGSLEHPAWSFAMDPTNFLRNLAAPSSPSTTPSPATVPVVPMRR
ncbi:MAG: AsmA-like C-terminal region-containing protein [Opitutaceae bacterium]